MESSSISENSSTSKSSSNSRNHIYYRITKKNATWRDAKVMEVNAPQSDIEKRACITKNDDTVMRQLKRMGVHRRYQLEKLLATANSAEPGTWQISFIEMVKKGETRTTIEPSVMNVILSRIQLEPDAFNRSIAIDSPLIEQKDNNDHIAHDSLSGPPIDIGIGNKHDREQSTATDISTQILDDKPGEQSTGPNFVTPYTEFGSKYNSGGSQNSKKDPKDLSILVTDAHNQSHLLLNKPAPLTAINCYSHGSLSQQSLSKSRKRQKGVRVPDLQPNIDLEGSDTSCSSEESLFDFRMEGHKLSRYRLSNSTQTSRSSYASSIARPDSITVELEQKKSENEESYQNSNARFPTVSESKYRYVTISYPGPYMGSPPSHAIERSFHSYSHLMPHINMANDIRHPNMSMGLPTSEGDIHPANKPVIAKYPGTKASRDQHSPEVNGVNNKPNVLPIRTRKFETRSLSMPKKHRNGFIFTPQLEDRGGLSQSKGLQSLSSGHSSPDLPEDPSIIGIGSDHPQSLPYSLDSDLMSMSDSSESTETSDFTASELALVTLLSLRLLLLYRCATQDQSSSGGVSGGNVATSGKTQTGTLDGDQGQLNKRNDRRHTEDENADEDGFCNPPSKKMKPDHIEGLKRVLACPFLKLDPVKYFDRCDLTLSRIRDVKQHLTRQHTPKRYCQRCLSTAFGDSDALQEHINRAECELRDPVMLEGISYEQRGKLSGKSKRNFSEQEQWFQIWDIVFPGRPRPTSAYLDKELSEEICIFEEFCSRNGPEILTEEIEAASAWTQAPEKEREIYLKRAIAEGIKTIFKKWKADLAAKSQRNGLPAIREHHKSSSLQLEPWTSSSTDSGVAYESNHSSSESLQQRNGLPIIRGHHKSSSLQLEPWTSSSTDSGVACESGQSSSEGSKQRNGFCQTHQANGFFPPLQSPAGLGGTNCAHLIPGFDLHASANEIYFTSPPLPYLSGDFNDFSTFTPN